MATDPTTAAESGGDKDLESVRVVYQELCKTFLAIDDIRLKLLGFLPLVTGAGISLLLEGRLSGISDEPYFFPIGVFGAIITAALFVYEHVGIRRCGRLIEAGRQLESRMRIVDAGQFMSLPHEARGYLYELAAALIYSSVFAAWAGLAGLSISLTAALWSALAAFVAAFSISFVAALLRGA